MSLNKVAEIRGETEIGGRWGLSWRRRPPNVPIRPPQCQTRGAAPESLPLPLITTGGLFTGGTCSSGHQFRICELRQPDPLPPYESESVDAALRSYPQ